MSITDFFKPKWRHSNPDVRRAEIRRLSSENQVLLAEIAQKESETDLRKLAVKKLRQPEILLKISSADHDADIRQLALQRFCDDLVRELKRNESMDNLDQALSAIQDVRYFEELARHAKSAEIRLLSLKNVEKESVLSRVAVSDTDEKVAEAAAKKVQKEGSLREILEKARVPQARSVASSRLKSLKNEEAGEDEEKLRQKKLEVVLSTMRRMGGKSCLQQQEEVEELIQEWNNLGGADGGEFAAELERFGNECAEQTRREEEKAAEEEREEQRRNQVSEILNDLDAIINEHAGEKASQRVEDIQQRYDALDFSPSANESARFHRSMERFQSQLEESEKARKTDEEEASHRDDLLKNLKELEQQEDGGFVRRQLQGLTRSWNQLRDLAQDHPLQKEFSEWSSKLQGRIDEEKQAFREEIDRRKGELQDIINNVRQMDEKEEFRQISRQLRDYFKQWKEIAGDQKKQFQDLWQDFKQATSRFEEMQQWEHWHNERDRESLAEELEEAVRTQEGGEDLYKTIRRIQKDWRHTGPVSRDRIDELEERLSTACDAGFEKCEPWLETQKAERENNLAEKQALCEKVEELVEQDIDNWKETVAQVREWQADWHETGPVPRDNHEEIRTRFKKACDDFYARHREFLASQEEVRLKNLELKEGLIQEAEENAGQTRWREGTEFFKKLQGRWKDIGSVPREQSEEIWKRFRAACDQFFEAKRAYYEELDQQKQGNLDAKEQLCVEMEALAESDDVTAMTQQSDELEQRWKEIGSVPREKSDEIWQRFCDASDKVYQKRLAADPELQKEVEENLEQKKGLIARASDLLENDNVAQATRALKDLQTEWKDLGRLGNMDQELWTKFRDVCDEFFEQRRDHFEIMEQNRINNLEKKILLCEEAEKVASMEDRDAGRREVKHLRRLWKETGPVPREKSDEIWDRFQKACNSLFDEEKTS